MGKKKKGNEAEADAIQMITLDDVRIREVKYSHRVDALKHCLNYLQKKLEQLEDLNEQNRLYENWLAYLSCDGLPKPHMPPEVRAFFKKLRYFENENLERCLDWTLSVDDRSVLNQDVFRVDMTRKTVKREQQPNFGNEYNENINLALKVLKSIEYYLFDYKMYSKAKPRILDDIKQQKLAVYREINEFFDRYCYRILCSESANMEDIDARTADYCFEGTHFRTHIWGVKNVPILFEFLEEPFLVANLHCLGVEITIPYSVLDDNLTIRGLHYDFDHFSEYAKSSDQTGPVKVDNSNAGITDLRDCLANEWKMQIQLQLAKRNMMVQKRLEYEELKRQFDEDEIQRAKDKKKEKDEKDKGKSKTKEIKLPKEPPIVLDNEVPDVWTEFLAKEQKEFNDFLNLIYHPDLLQLESHELNLKKYLILGGIYQLDFVDKPRHVDFRAFNITWHENNHKLSVKSNLRIDAPEFVRTTAFSRASNIRRESNARKSIMPPTSNFNPNSGEWFVVHMILPEHLCLWGEPKPCHFEADAIGYIEEKRHKVQPDVESLASKKGKKHGAAGGGSGAGSAAASKIVPSETASVAASKIVPAEPVPVKPSAGEIKAVASFLRQSIHSVNMSADHQASVSRMASAILADMGAGSRPELLSMGLADFDLNLTLTKSEIRNLQRHCLPRIISSYKFPSEFTAEAKQLSAKAKSAGGTLIRRQSALLAEGRGSSVFREKYGRTFNTLDQAFPERIFPLFPTPDELKIRKLMADVSAEGPPKTFLELIKRLDAIKKYYMSRVSRTSNLPAFKPNMKLMQKQPVRMKTKGKTKSSRRSTKAPSRAGSTSSVRTRKSAAKAKTGDTSQIVSAAEDEEEDEEEDEDEEYVDIELPEETRAPSMASIDNRKTFTFSRWTTQYIKHSEFDRQKRTLTIWTDRLGVFGLAYKRYEQLPFRFWSLEPSEEHPDSEVCFTLETQFAKVVLFITGEGIRGYVTDLQKKFVRNRPMYLVIEKPIKDLRELRKRFREKNLNIFTERDASFYIENGYFCQKHLATEMHTYCCMCSHAHLMRFIYSEWNRLSSRRNLVFRLLHHREIEDYICTVRITPEDSTFVNITELCSDDLDVFNLEYTLTWRNIDFYADLHHLITSMYPSAPDQRVKNPHLVYYLKAILCEIRPLSFS